MTEEVKPKNKGGNPNLKPGVVLNPDGRPKGSRNRVVPVEERLRKKHKINPVDRLVDIATTTSDSELATEIWLTLLKYCDAPKPAQRKKESKEPDPKDSKKAAENAFKLLQDIENATLQSNKSPTNDPAPGSSETSLGDGKDSVQAEARSKKDLRLDNAEQGSDLRRELQSPTWKIFHDGADSGRGSTENSGNSDSLRSPISESSEGVPPTDLQRPV